MAVSRKLTLYLSPLKMLSCPIATSNKLRAAMALGASGKVLLEQELDKLLGGAWDDELEPFRRAGDGAPVRWLNATG